MIMIVIMIASRSMLMGLMRLMMSMIVLASWSMFVMLIFDVVVF